MSQPLQHQDLPTPPRRVLITVPSKFFTPGRPYDVARWLDGIPSVRNDSGSFTWLVDARFWQPVPEPMTMERSQELLHAAWRASRAAIQDL